MGLCDRLVWPSGFQELAADRVAKGFSIVQIVAGLYPDMEPFDDRGANEAGFPWSRDFSTVNPAYFDMADLRIAHLVRSGLVPCIVGFWGFFLDVAGSEVLRNHWRYLVARYGAYPVVWCVAGEALMRYYLSDDWLSETREAPAEKRETWTDITHYLRSIDCFGRPITIHPTYPSSSREQIDDPTVIDFEMLQTGHFGNATLIETIDMLEEALARPPMPVLVGEASYEGIMESNRSEHQRFLFWACLLSGACGHTYGANGIWQVDLEDVPYGRSPHGMSWGGAPWDDAYRLPGSGQLGLAKALLERYRWWEFEPHAEWIEPHQSGEKRISCYAAGIPGEVRIAYIPADAVLAFLFGPKPLIKELEAGIKYRGYYFDPVTGETDPVGTVEANVQGDYLLPKPPVLHDWVFVLERLSS
jgi:hypothetical protein